MSFQYLTTTGTSSTTNLAWASAGTGGAFTLTSPPARKPGPLEWLDGETEKVCALARDPS